MLRNIHIWILPYLKQRLLSLGRTGSRSVHILFCVADHFEPLWGGADAKLGEERVARWIEAYERIATGFADSDGHHPRHTYFFPLEQHEPRYIHLLRDHCRKGFGEVELHLHHNNDTEDNFRRTIEHYKKMFQSDGFLGLDREDKVRYGFVHGNWALDNSSPDGSWCGLNNEITLLHETGCYADFTLPSAPSPTQTTTINSIYYAVDDPEKPKSHNRGFRVSVGGRPPDSGNHLMIIQGALGLDWKWRRLGIIPRIENSEISLGHPPLPHRWKLWRDASICVAGRPEWLFIKVHMHGCTGETQNILFDNGAFRALHESIARLRKENEALFFHYVSAREMYNIVKAAEAGKEDNPIEFKDYEISPPPLTPAGR